MVDRHVEDLPENIYSNTFGLHFPWERNVSNLLQFLSKVFLSKPATLRGWSPCWLSRQYLFEYIRSSISKLVGVACSQKKCSFEGVDRHVDLPDNIYSNTFALQFPSKAFLPLKKKQWSPRWLSALHFPWEQNVRTKSSLLSKISAAKSEVARSAVLSSKLAVGLSSKLHRFSSCSLPYFLLSGFLWFFPLLLNYEVSH